MGGGASKSKAESSYVLSVADEYAETAASSSDLKSARSSGKKLEKTNTSSSPDSEPSPKPSPLQTTRKSFGPTVSQGATSKQDNKKVGIAALSRSGSSIGRGIGAAAEVRASERFPWLVKGGNFSNLTIASLELGRVVGTGLMGTVRIANVTGKKCFFALKGVRKDFISRRNDERHLKNERELMLQLNNPFCIKLFRTMQDMNNVYFLMELAVGGELFRRLSKKASFPPQVAKFYVCEIFSAIEHVQSLGYVYRDLKPENVMLDEDGHCKLVDFGFSTMPDGNGVVKTLCGTPAYLSPEQLEGKFTNGYKSIVDWWSLGILVYELLTGRTPFCNSHSESSYEIYLRIMKNNISFPRGFDDTSKDLVKSLCHPDVSKRLVDPGLIAAHSYFTVPWPAVHARKLIPPYVPRITDENDRDHYFNQYKEPPPITDSATSCKMQLEGF